MEEQAREFRAFREAQRSMLDQLSIGVAQFDAERRLTFANQPFQRIFALPPAARLDPLAFDRFLDMARDAGRLPEARDFPGLAARARRLVHRRRAERGRLDAAATARTCGSSPSRCPTAGWC